MRKYLILAGLLFTGSLMAQETFPVNGMHEKPGTVHVFTNAHIVLNPKQEIENGMLIIKDDRIVSVGSSGSIPKGAIVHDMEGKYIYPSFIDLYSNYGLEKPKNEPWKPQPQLNSNTKGAYAWNQALKPEFSAGAEFSTDAKVAEGLRAKGFGAVMTHQMDGIARGTGAMVTLADKNDNTSLLQEDAAAFYSFKKGTSRQQYPSSLMGVIALLRQTYYDADWYARQKQQEEKNLSLEAWNDNQKLPQFFEAGDYLSTMRADKICDEFTKQYIFIGSGDEYKRAKDIKALYGSFVLPLNFPKPYDVEDPFEADIINLGQMKHWEMAPYNPAILDKESIEIAFTSNGDKKFLEHLRLAVEKGLSKETAIRALTLTPAKLVQIDKELGSLAKGKIANFIVCSDDIFKEKTKIYENWVQGSQYIVSHEDNVNYAGMYELQLDTLASLEIKGDGSKPKANIIVNDSTKIPVKMMFDGNLLSFNFYDKATGNWTFTGYQSGDVWQGKGADPEGEVVVWSLKAKPDETEKADEKDEAADKKKDKKEKVEFPKVAYPNMAYGWTEAPEQAAVIFKNATVWTNEEDGILENMDVAVSRGEIIAIGKNINPSNVFLKWKGKVEEVDATGMHLTSGIIDEHSHIAISKGVNEGTQASSAEVSIADVINSDDINIYRQLSGGVTAAQLLHGSANPIGGQSGIIKLRWGKKPEDMKFKEAPGSIKFALGENVKQSNWGDFNTVRYPQSRMGVEQIYYDNFIRAKEYEADWKAYGALGLLKRNRMNPPRRDLELQTLVEILNGKRFVTCHSYIQSEINMLMHVADSMGFRMNTFTHILEGYKVADKMKEHGVGGSTFSDWWAYKYEVNDAIPYNGAILHDMGVVTAFNSDDAEMARRLNQEAAKAVKYGGVSEEEAWKFVTLNPAKLLHVDKYVGSVKVGKQADLVLWSDNPLSINAKAMRTYVDGVCYFDRAKDAEMREQIREERARLIQEMLDEKAGGRATQKAKPANKILYHCDTMENYE